MVFLQGLFKSVVNITFVYKSLEPGVRTSHCKLTSLKFFCAGSVTTYRTQGPDQSVFLQHEKHKAHKCFFRGFGGHKNR